jgi:hypothetical protein
LAAGDDVDDEGGDGDGDGNDSVGAAASAAGSEGRRISASATEAEADGGTPLESGTIERDECCCGVKGRVRSPAQVHPLLWRRSHFASENRYDDEEGEGQVSHAEGDTENAQQEKKDWLRCDARRPITSSITERRRLL